jgi:hypothetical protein
LTLLETVQFTTIQQLYEDLRDRVATELHKIASSDPPKKIKDKDVQVPAWNQKSKKSSKKKKKRAPFDPPTGVKLRADMGLSIGGTVITTMKSKDIERISLLLSGWGDSKAINIPNDEGCTALMMAASKGRADVVEALIKKGADVTVKDKWGKTALHKAASHGHNDIVTLLINANSDTNAKDNFGNTPLHSSIRNCTR